MSSDPKRGNQPQRWAASVPPESLRWDQYQVSYGYKMVLYELFGCILSKWKLEKTRTLDTLGKYTPSVSMFRSSGFLKRLAQRVRPCDRSSAYTWGQIKHEHVKEGVEQVSPAVVWTPFLSLFSRWTFRLSDWRLPCVWFLSYRKAPSKRKEVATCLQCFEKLKHD